MTARRDAYTAFVQSKLTRSLPTGLASPPAMPPWLFPFQADLVRWALRRGRCALFTATGTGKMRMELAWASAVALAAGVNVLILAPLAVAQQIAREGAAVGLPVALCRSGDDAQPGLNVTNYERLHRFDPAKFGAVVCDESSIIKHHHSSTLKQLKDFTVNMAFRLCATATPAPNDWTELATHADLLGVCTRQEMLSEFFVHDGGDTSIWRLKGHARDAFWRWVVSWGALLRLPSDLGYEDGGFALPALRVHQHLMPADQQSVKQTGLLFAIAARTLTEQRQARKGSLDARVSACAELVNASPDEQWLVWCDLNAESEALTKAIAGAVQVTGSDELEHKEQTLMNFAEGRVRALVTKPSLAGFGLNFQRCAKMAFVGVTHSWEAYYQAVRRCWRFGQTRPVDVHVFASELEGAVVANLQRKERDAQAMADALSIETRAAVRQEVRGTERSSNTYAPKKPMRVPEWLTSEVV